MGGYDIVRANLRVSMDPTGLLDAIKVVYVYSWNILVLH